MSWLSSYLREAEGRLLLYVMIVCLLLDFFFRLLPSTTSAALEKSAEATALFERQRPSEAFDLWVTARRDAKNAEADKIAQELAKQEVSAPEPIVPEVFIDAQSGKLQQFRIGNLKYRLWGVFSVSSASERIVSKFAVLRPDAGASRVVSVGDAVENYSVVSIEDRSVSFKADDGRMVELELFERRG